MISSFFLGLALSFFLSFFPSFFLSFSLSLSSFLPSATAPIFHGIYFLRMFRFVKGKMQFVKHLLSTHTSPSQMQPLNPVHIFKPSFFRIINVVFPSTPSSPKLSLSLLFSDCSPVCIFYVLKYVMQNLSSCLNTKP
jgi:hypothetical protein